VPETRAASPFQPWLTAKTPRPPENARPALPTPPPPVPRRTVGHEHRAFRPIQAHFPPALECSFHVRRISAAFPRIDSTQPARHAARQGRHRQPTHRTSRRLALPPTARTRE